MLRERDLVIFHAAADAVVVSAEKGTRAKMIVPWFGFELVENSPPTNFRRSLMLVRPSPCPLLATLASNPAPESCTLSSIPRGEPAKGYFEYAYTAVFHRIMKSFLQNTEEAK